MTQAPAASERDSFATLRKIDVSQYVEKKNGLSYLSWAWAVDQLLQRDPSATWEYRNGTEVIGDHRVEVPYVLIGSTAMVFCTVKAFGVERTAQLPVMDHRNKPIPNPDAFQVNTAMQRCLAKAIALHGIGLYIYNGEDLPPEDEKGEVKPTTTADGLLSAKAVLNDCNSVDELRATYEKFTPELKAALKEYVVALKKSLQ